LADLTALLEDNAVCIYMATNYNKPMAPRRKHINTRIFKLLEFIEEGVLTLVKIELHCNVADCLTKALLRISVEMARDYMFWGPQREGVKDLRCSSTMYVFKHGGLTRPR
jgi:hypothetical protein